MRNPGWVDVLERVKFEEYDLIGYRIVSPFHLVAFTAFAQNFHPEKQSLKLLIIVSKGPWGKSILTRAPIPDPRLEITFIDDEESGLHFPAWWPLFLLLRPFFSWGVKLAGRTQIPVCATSLSCLRFSSRSLSALWHFQPILIDEGIGSFNTLHNFRQEAYRKFRNKSIQAFAMCGLRLVYGGLQVLGGKHVTLFSFKGQKPRLHLDVADSYRKVFKEGYDRRNRPLEFDGPLVLILTQPFAEMGYCAANELVDEVEKLAKKICQMGFKPALKLHPAEDEAKYLRLAVKRVEYEGPVEEIFAGAGKDIAEIWGFNSTSLIFGSALYGIRSRRLDLPWPGAGSDVFKGEAQLLFSTYTETL